MQTRRYAMMSILVAGLGAGACEGEGEGDGRATAGIAGDERGSWDPQNKADDTASCLLGVDRGPACGWLAEAGCWCDAQPNGTPELPRPAHQLRR